MTGSLLPQDYARNFVGDFNGDGIQDLLCRFGELPSVPGGSPTYYLQTWFGNGDGTFTKASTRTQIEFPSNYLTIADFDGDGKQDVAFINYPGLVPDPTVSIFLGNGDGTFHQGVTAASGTYYSGIAAGDLNGDGKMDLIFANQDNQPASVLLGRGDGTFTTLPPDQSLNQISESIALGDFNGDGIPDLVFPNENAGYTSVFLGKGDGTFVPDVNSPSVADSYSHRSQLPTSTAMANPTSWKESSICGYRFRMASLPTTTSPFYSPRRRTPRPDMRTTSRP